MPSEPAGSDASVTADARISLIWAQAADGVIGEAGSIPWHLPEDLAHFKELTHGGAVIMGRRTWDSLPERFRPLAGRRNIVITRQKDWSVEGATVVLVDDVLYTGRTTRAAINELFDYGRPARVMLAALADRGGRELPIAADFVAQTISISDQRQLVLQRAEDGRFSLTVDHA